MKTFLAIVLILCTGSSCPKTEPKQAAPTAKMASSVPAAISEAHAKALAAIAAAEAKLAALEEQAAIAAAQIESARIANTNQPSSPTTTIVDKEAGLAQGNLPPPNTQAQLDAAKRRLAIESGNAEESKKLYALAQTETERMKSENSRLKSEGEAAKSALVEAHAALVAAEKSHVALLEKNRAANQAALDDLAAKLKKSEDDRKNAEMKEQVRALRLVGLGCLVAGILFGVMTNGVQWVKSVGFGVFAVICFGLAQIVAHPLFLPVSIACIVVVVAVVGWLFWRERKDTFKISSMEKQVKVLDGVEDLEAVPVKREDGTLSNLATEFSRKMNDPEKAVVKQIRLAQAVKEAKAEAKA